MDDGRAQIIERGVLTAPDEAWDVAVRQAGVIGRLAAEPQVGLAARDAAADRGAGSGGDRHGAGLR
ncbi:hypothetical protein ABZ897_20090 [Nonomuraea sp. NPDC046802]|uniref:hypothetical protein n=1 Tax=Nonomuraea sp. NPDC046802 TaxID=3154919 RepID=UPI0033E7A008